MRIAVLVKQVPKFDAMELGPDGRLVREGLELEMNPYCRRAVSKVVELAQATGGTCTVFTLGPPAAEDTLREAIAWGATDGVLISDPAFAGSDTLATAKALAAALSRAAFRGERDEGPYDLVLTGRNSVDADTGQVGPELAELLDLPFATGVKHLELGDRELKVLCEEDDGQSDRVVSLPAIVSTAERLIEPAKVDPEGRAAVSADRLRTISAAELGEGPWGQDGSGTYVGEVRVLEVGRANRVLSGSIDAQVDEAFRLLHARGALDDARDASPVEQVPPPRALAGPVVAVVVEPGRDNVARELLGAAARLAADIDGQVIGITTGPPPNEIGAWGADAVVCLNGAQVEEDVAGAVAEWAIDEQPWAILLPSTTWGREVGGRAAARLDAGLTGDAVELEVSTVASTGQRQLVAWKPAFGGRLVAAIYCSSPIQMATVRAGVLPMLAPRGSSFTTATIEVEPRGRVVVTASARDDDISDLANAAVVLGVGTGVKPDEYAALEPLLGALGAELGATRKVTDKAWLPRARQIGITGRSIAPRLYIAIGLSGKFNHMVGVRAAGTILAINDDIDALIWEHADIGIVGDWHEVVPRLASRLERPG
jgi:electron transfer flavoprotein alpha subunit